MPDGTQTLTMADALAEARAELEPASSDVTETAVPAVEVEAPATDEHAPAVEVEQPAADSVGFTEEQEALAASLIDTDEESQNGSGSGIVPGSDDFWNLTVDVETVNGPENVSVRELTDGYLRQADYTRKTQAVAEESKRADRALQMMKSFEEDPAGFTRSLAVQAGLIREGDAPVKIVDVAKIPTPEDLETRVNEMVEDRVSKDQRVQRAAVSDARIQIDVEFDRLETAYEIPLSKDLRDDLIREAQSSGSHDLEGLLTRRLLRTQQKQSRAADANLASTSRPGTTPASASSPDGGETTEKPTMREAWNQSKVAAASE